MAFFPKKSIPPVAAAGMALVGCGSDGDLDDLADRLDPAVSAFCMQAVECNPSLGEDYVDYCRGLYLYYAQTYITLSDDASACEAAFLSYFGCFTSCDADCEAPYQELGEGCSAWGTL
jgi:hypothetical protein